jgi:hypothetical protein
MSALTIDTLAVSQLLRKRGFNEEQATGVVEALREIDASQLATKADIREVEARIERVEGRLEAKIETLELRMTIKLGGLIIAATGVILAAVRYLPAGHP